MTNKPSYIITVIRKFGERFSLSGRQSYTYLKTYSGIEFLDECYEAEHQLSYEDAVSDLVNVCQIHGGNLK